MNNIPLLAMGFGAGPGLAGALSVAVLAVAKLYAHWDELMSAMGMSRIKTEAEQMDELAKSTDRTAEATDRLNKYKREQAQIETILQSRPKKEVEAEEKYMNVIADVGVGKVETAITRTLKKRGTDEHMTPQEEEEMKGLRERVANPFAGGVDAKSGGSQADFERRQAQARAMLENRSKEINKRLEDATKAKADKLMLPSNRANLQTLIAANPDEFPADLAQKLKQTTPEAIKLVEDLNKQGKENEPEAIKEANKINQARAQREKEIAKQLEDAASLKLLRDKNADISPDVKAGLAAAGIRARHIDKRAENVVTDVTRQVEERVQNRVIRTGVSEDKAREQELAIEQQKQKQEAKHDRMAMHDQNRVSELAKSLESTTGIRMLTEPTLNAEADVKTRLKKAGISDSEAAELVKPVAEHLMETMDKQVLARSLDKGITEPEARKQLGVIQTKEKVERDRAEMAKAAGAPSERMGLLEYAQSHTVGQLKDPTVVAEAQLKEQEKTNLKIDALTTAVKAAQGGVATFAKKGA